MQQHPPRSHAIRSRVRSFSRAGGRLTDAQQEALARFGGRYVIDVPRADAIRTVDASFRLDPAAAFGHPGRARPLVVEVGSGGGEALLAHALAHPGTDHLAVEVWETAIARIVRDAARAGLDNVRVVPADAAQLLATALPVGSASEVWVFFPDPWRKARHRKRRLVTESFADSVARVLRPGGVWRLATDWADYAWQMRDVVEAVSSPHGAGRGSGQGLPPTRPGAGLHDSVGHALTASLPPTRPGAGAVSPCFRHDDAGARPDLGAGTAVDGDPGNGLDPGSPSGVRGGWSERFTGRVMTRFEARGLKEGRTVRDLCVVRTSQAWVSPG